MGGISFINRVDASAAKIGFDNLVSAAIYDNGNSPYNGTISTCDGMKHVKTFDKYCEKNVTKAEKIVDETLSSCIKYTAYYIDLGIKYYQIKEVKKVNKEYTAKYKQMFAVRDVDDKILKTFDTKPKADSFALQQTLLGNCVTVKKQMIKLHGNDTVTTFTVKKRTQKTKPKLKQNDKRIIIPIHSYIFYGFAGC